MDENRMKKWIIATTSITLIILITVAAYVVLSNQPPKGEQNNQTEPMNYTYTVVNTFPHDTTAFTEGLVYQDGFLYESTGLNGNSTLRREELETGQTLQLYSLPSQYFGEGITISGDKIIQLTWQSQVGFVYNKTTFQLLDQFTYPTEGWGITNNGTTLIMSDGTPTLYFLNPETYKKTGDIQVHDGNTSITMLNELEYVKGDIYANVWHEDRIAIINITTGQVKGWINLAGLNKNPIYDPEDVLNGIAYDSMGDRLFVTGKRWSQLFQINLVPAG
jgi:glutamine cyclotransferase